MAPLRLTAAALAAAVVAAAAPPASAQEEAPAGADTTARAADTARVDAFDPDRGERADPAFPPPLETEATAASARVRSWGREELLDSSALSLQDFLLDHAPGVLPLRAGFFYGPHQLADGLWGPGGVRVVVDGRELPPLSSGQPDLSRISLATVERVRLVRRAGESVVRVTTLAHASDEAYSRISAGTGQPGADGIRGVFTNRAGDDFVVQAAIDHLNVGAGRMPGNRIDAWAKVGWTPWGGETGFEVAWQSESLERTVDETTDDFSRGGLMLHGRTLLAEGLQADVWFGRTSRDPRPDFFPEPTTPGDSMPDDTMPPDSMPSDSMPGDSIPSDSTAAGPRSFEVEQLLASLTWRGEGTQLRVTGERRDGKGVRELSLDVRGAVRLGRLVAEAGAEVASWEEVSTSAWSGGLAYRPAWWEGAVLRLEAATGSRAAPRPGRVVGDSLVQDYEAISVGAEAELGPYRLSGSVGRRSVDRQLPFGGFFDRRIQATGELTVRDVEATFRGPPLPLGYLGDHLTVRGFWRYTSPTEEGSPFYLPDVLVRGEGLLRDEFFDGNLEVRLVGRAVHRGAMVSARPGSPEAVVLPPATTFRSEVTIRIDTFRIWWRTDNLRGAEQRDFGDLAFPASRNVFGIRWEFFN